MNDWITIAYNVGPVEMAVLNDRFEEEGIPFVITGGNSAYPSIAAVQGGTKIQVPKSDEQRALEILKETGYLE
jgi:hypothetical protein